MFIAAWPILILIVIVGVMVLCAVINKFSWKSLLILSALFLVMLLAPMFHYRQRAYIVEQVTAPSWSSPASSSMPAIWTEGMEDEFQADIYPSEERAALALARQAAPLLSSLTPKQSQVSSIEVDGSGSVPIQLLNVFADKLKELTGVSDMLVQSNSSNNMTQDPNSVAISLLRAHWDHGSRSYSPYPTRNHSTRGEVLLQEGSGTLRIDIVGRDRQHELSRSVEVIEKPWVQDLNSVLNEHPNAPLVVARSSETCTDQLEARQQAMNSAVSMVQSVIKQVAPSDGVNHIAINAISEQDLTQFDLILDQFSQSFNSTNSRIWRHAILLDLDSNKLTPLLQSRVSTTTRERVSHRLRWARQFGSLGGLALIVLVLYVFLNAATKGYYTWSLRIAAVILIGVFIVALLNFV